MFEGTRLPILLLFRAATIVVVAAAAAVGVVGSILSVAQKKKQPRPKANSQPNPLGAFKPSRPRQSLLSGKAVNKWSGEGTRSGGYYYPALRRTP